MFKISAHFELRTDKLNARGYAPLILMATIKGKRAKIALNETLPPECFDKQTQRAKYSNKHKEFTQHFIDTINAMLIEMEATINNIRIDCRKQSKEIDIEAFKYYLNNPRGAESFIQFAQQQIELNKKYITADTHRHELQMLEKLMRYKSNVTFQMINQQFIDGFRKFLMTKLALHNNTTNNVLKKLNKYIKLAREYKHPVDAIKLKSKEIPSNRIWLTLDELAKLQNIYNTHQLPETYYRTLHYFLLLSYTSLRISDKHQITLENINATEKTLRFIPTKTMRTNKVLNIVLTDVALDFVLQHLTKNVKPYSDQKLNQYLKEVLAYADIKKPATFHSARHTFAYNYITSGGSVTTLKEILGHNNIQTTMVYAHVDMETQRVSIDKVNNYLSQNLK